MFGRVSLSLSFTGIFEVPAEVRVDDRSVELLKNSTSDFRLQPGVTLEIDNRFNGF